MRTPLAPGARLVLAVIPVAALAVLVTLALSGTGRSMVLADPGPLVRWGGPVLSVANHLAAAVVLGTVTLLLGVLPYERGRAPAWARAATVLAWSAPVWTVVNLADVLMRYALATGRTMGGEAYGQELAYYLTELSAGRAALLATVLIALTAVAAAGVRTYRGVVLVALPALAVLLPWSVRGHASSAADHDLAIGAMWLHLLGVAVWVGGLIVLCLLAGLLGAHTVAVVRRYSTVALWSFAAVGLSGLASGVIRLNGPGDLTRPYGMVLVAKVVLFTALGVLGWWHRRRTVVELDRGGARVRGFWRLAGVETLLMATVTGVAAVLAITPTPVPDTLPYVPSPAEELSGRPVPPPPTVGTWLTQVDPDVVFIAGLAALAAAYLAGVRRCRREQVAWPRTRTTAFLAGVVLAGWALLGGPMVYGQLMVSAHLAWLVILALLVPGLWALGAPLTLALRVLPRRTDDSRGPQEYLRAALGSVPLRCWARPAVATVILPLSLAIVHATGLFRLVLTTQIALVLLVVHAIVAGYLFITVFLPADPALDRLTGRRPPVRPVALALVAVGLLTVMVLTLAGIDRLLAADHFGALGLPWGVDALADQRLGAVVLAVGAGIPLLALTVLAVRDSRARSQPGAPTAAQPGAPTAIAGPAAPVPGERQGMAPVPGQPAPAVVPAQQDAGSAPAPAAEPGTAEADDADARAYARMLARRRRR